MLNRLKHDISDLLQTHKAKVPYVVAIALIVFIYLVRTVQHTPRSASDVAR